MDWTAAVLQAHSTRPAKHACRARTARAGWSRVRESAGGAARRFEHECARVVSRFATAPRLESPNAYGTVLLNACSRSRRAFLPEKVSKFAGRSPRAVLTVGTQIFSVSALCAVVALPGFLPPAPVDSSPAAVVIALSPIAPPPVVGAVLTTALCVRLACLYRRYPAKPERRCNAFTAT